MTMITPSYLGETIEYSSLHACRSTLEDPTAAYMKHPPTMKAAELAAVIAIIAASALYHWLFLMLSRATPGMRYARISICTFDDEIPSREQLRNRLGAMLLSLLPVGLGVGWAIFDDDHLTWHDRLSRTYLRRY